MRGIRTGVVAVGVLVAMGGLARAQVGFAGGFVGGPGFNPGIGAVPGVGLPGFYGNSVYTRGYGYPGGGVAVMPGYLGGFPYGGGYPGVYGPGVVGGYGYGYGVSPLAPQTYNGMGILGGVIKQSTGRTRGRPNW